MKVKRTLMVVILAFVLVSLPFLLAKVTHAQGMTADEGAVMGKLDQVLANQRSIMDQLAALKEELAIVKIRVTQRS